MPLEFTNLIKGVTTQSYLTVLLELGGYRVTRLGIEELLGEVKHLDLGQYHRLDLPFQLRYLPDLLIVELDMSNAFLIEVKYRLRFTDESARWLHEKLIKQHEYWPQVYTIIMVSEPFKQESSYHQDYIRVVRPDDLNILVDQSLTPSGKWEKLQHLQRVFKSFNNTMHAADVQKAGDTLTKSLRALANL